jgi:aconitase A
MGDYLKSTGRSGIASASEAFKAHLTADEGCKYDQVVEIDLSTLEPHINGPFTPDLATPLSQFKAAAAGQCVFPCVLQQHRYCSFFHFAHPPRQLEAGPRS